MRASSKSSVYRVVRHHQNVCDVPEAVEHTLEEYANTLWVCSGQWVRLQKGFVGQKRYDKAKGRSVAIFIGLVRVLHLLEEDEIEDVAYSTLESLQVIQPSPEMLVDMHRTLCRAYAYLGPVERDIELFFESLTSDTSSLHVPFLDVRLDTWEKVLRLYGDITEAEKYLFEDTGPLWMWGDINVFGNGMIRSWVKYARRGILDNILEDKYHLEGGVIRLTLSELEEMINAPPRCAACGAGSVRRGGEYWCVMCGELVLPVHS